MSNETGQMPEYQNWFLTEENDVVWLKIDKPDSSQNILSSHVLKEFDEIVQYLEQHSDRYKGLVIYSEKPGCFIAGADINEFVTLESEEQAIEYIGFVHGVFNRLEDLPMTTICLIDGVVLGGGLELALPCDYLVMSDESHSKIGLPEVKLGIHPGFGGSVRMIERVGAIKGMNLMLAGRIIGAYQAKKCGLVDLVVAKRHIKNSVHYLINAKPKRKKAHYSEKLLSTTLGRRMAAKKMRQELKKKVNQTHYPAPYKLVDLWEEYGGDRKEMLKQEFQSIAGLFLSPTSRGLVKVFFLQEEMKKLGKQDISPHTDVQHVHVIGAGVMGGDIAAYCALKGLTVTISDMNKEALASAKQRAYELFSKKLKSTRLTERAMDRFTIDPQALGVAKADIIIEAIVENLEIKQKVFAAIEQQAKADAILATNTSSIPLEDIARSLSSPERLIGVHFFNPVAKMMLVEIVASEYSAQVSLNRGMVFTKQISKLPVPVKSSPGFLVNRVLMPYLMEAIIMLEEGISPHDIDQAAKDFGMPMGPVELADVVGLDICLNVGQMLQEKISGQTPAILTQKIDDGHLGRKSGQGFYQWDKGKVVKEKSASGESNKDSQQIQDRLILRYLNECVACMREGIVDQPSYIDGAMVFGTGFAPFTAGPMNYISATGKDTIVDKLTLFSDQIGERFQPDSGWNQLT